MQTESLRGVIVYGSARSDGNTSRVVKALADLSGYDVIDLNVLKIAYYDYVNPEDTDDFLPTIEKILHYPVVVFATPVYWYAMSAVLKTFFDRISDLLDRHKSLGRQLRGKSMGLVSTSEKQNLNEAFVYPFKSTAIYLGMDFLGHVHCWTTKGRIGESAKESLQAFADQLLLAETDHSS